MDNSVEILNEVRWIFDHLNPKTFEAMIRKAMCLSINSKRLLCQIAEVTHDRALHCPKLTKLYGKFAAYLMKVGFCGTAGRGEHYQSYILCKCYDSLQKCITMSECTSPILVHGHTRHFVANCEFIGELYKQDIYPETDVWSFVTDLTQGCNSLTTYCLCSLLKSAGAKLSKTYNLNEIVEHLQLQLVTRDSVHREIPLSLRQLIKDIKEMHINNWIHKTVPEDIEAVRLEGPAGILNEKDADDLTGKEVSVADEATERNLSKVQEEMIEDDLPIVLENDDSARLGGSTYLLDYGQDVSLSDNESDREISKNFFVKIMSKYLCEELTKSNCVEEIVREDEELILPVVSTVHQNTEDATDEIREKLFLPDEVTVSSTIEMAELLRVQSAIETWSKEIQLEPEDDKLGFQEVSAELLVEENVIHFSGDITSCPEILVALPVDQNTANVQRRCSMEGVPQTRSERRKSVWKRLRYWSLNRFRVLVPCVP